MTTTTNYGWTLPTVGADAGTWGTSWNNNLVSMDSTMFAKFDKAGGTVSGPATITGNLIVGSVTNADVVAKFGGATDGVGLHYNGTSSVIYIGGNATGSVAKAFFFNRSTGTLTLAHGTWGGSFANQLTVDINGNFYPAVDNTLTLGVGSQRWSVVYAGTGAINTSDETEKQDIAPIDDALLDAWEGVEFLAYRFKDAVKAKGDGARVHFGLMAQRVKSALEAKGLDPFRYGLLCCDTQDDGSLLYGLRYDECMVLEMALARRARKSAAA